MAERSVAVEVKIKGMKWEDFNDNEYIENLVNELKENGQNVVVGKFDESSSWHWVPRAMTWRVSDLRWHVQAHARPTL